MIWSVDILLNLVLICFNPLYKHPCLVGKGRASNSSSFLLPVVLSDPVGFIFLPNADFCSLVVTVGCLSGGIKNVYWGFCHNASSLVFIFLMTREVDDLWVFIELDRSGLLVQLYLWVILFCYISMEYEQIFSCSKEHLAECLASCAGSMTWRVCFIAQGIYFCIYRFIFEVRLCCQFSLLLVSWGIQRRPV